MKNFRYMVTMAIAVMALSGCSVIGGGTAKLNKRPDKTETTETPVAVKRTAENNVAAGSINGEWTITEVGDVEIIRDEDMPYVNFDERNGRFYASNGCNILNGSFVLSDDVLAFESVMSTMRMCPDVPYELDINAVLQNGMKVRVRVGNTDGQPVMLLSTLSGKHLMTLRRHGMEFLNGSWKVTSINGNDVDDDEANIFFDIAELKVHGNTGCNYFNGSIYIDPSAHRSISFGEMGVTRMACPKSAQETAMLVALEQTTACINGKHDTAILLDASGKKVMTLHKINRTE